MISKCLGCFRNLGWKVLGHERAKWQVHIDSYCHGKAQKYPWCQMFLDNMQLIHEHQSLSKEIQLDIKNTNIASEIVKIVDSHYDDGQSLLKFCIDLFGSYLKLKYSDVINPTRNTLQKMGNDYFQFLVFLTDLIVIYYNLQDRQIIGQDLFYKSTLPNLAMTLLFKNQDINSTVHKIVKLAFKNVIEKAQFNIQKFQQNTIDDYGLSLQIRLNQKTLQMFSIQRCLGEQDRPYSGASQIMKEIVRVVSPADKLQLIEGLQKQIDSTILRFYKKHGIKVQGSSVQRNDLSAVLCYIVVQANQPNLLAHIQVANYFGPKRANRGQNCLQILSNIFQQLQKGSIFLGTEIKKISQEYDFQSNKNLQVKSYFDEVSTFDL